MKTATAQKAPLSLASYGQHEVYYSYSGDRSRPYRVKFTGRSFNQIVGQYDSEASAKRRARDLNKPG